MLNWNRSRTSQTKGDLRSELGDNTGQARVEGNRPADRVSDALASFIARLGAGEEQHVLDLGDLSQQTVGVLAQPGRHLHFAPLLARFQQGMEAQGDDGTLSEHSAHEILREGLPFGDRSMHGVLAWDVLQHLGEPGMQAAAATLRGILKPNGILFCLFHLGNANEAPVCRCGVTSHQTFSLHATDRRPIKRQLSTRDLELLFDEFRAVHFFLKRDAALLEVLVFT